MKFLNTNTGEVVEFGGTYINSALVSAQNRLRMYWTNFEVTQPEDKGILLRDIIEESVEDKFSLSDEAIAYMNRSSEKWSNGKTRIDIYNNKLDGKALCLTANMYKGVPYGVILEKNRKLTPLECERLQTFNDGWTDFVSNTQRYKALGNAWTVDVIAHILKCMLKEKK